MTVTSQSDPAAAFDMVIDTTTLKPVPKTITNPIIAAGVTSQIITISAGSSIVWPNQTPTNQELLLVEKMPDLRFICP